MPSSFLTWTWQVCLYQTTVVNIYVYYAALITMPFRIHIHQHLLSFLHNRRKMTWRWSLFSFLWICWWMRGNEFVFVSKKMTGGLYMILHERGWLLISLSTQKIPWKFNTQYRVIRWPIGVVNPINTIF